AAAPSTEQLEWFRREVRLARRITHPNVARTHDMGEQAGAHYITMEFIEGTTLHELLGEDTQGPGRRQALALVQAVRIAAAVCDGLAAAHAAGVVHRDLKPANVLIERGGRVVLTDFGIARALSDEQAGARTQGVVGTPQYMAPEQLSGTPVDARADVYALGLMLFEMVTGALPFAGGTPLASALARLTERPPDPRTLRSGLPDALATLILECLATAPNDRPPTVMAVGERLRSWLVAEGATLPGVQAPGESGSSNPITPPGTSRTLSRPQRPLVPMMQLTLTQRALAVLPFRHIGPAEQSYLGDALTDELIDVLSRTRGLRVLGSGATAKYRTDRDPRAVGADLGVDAVVDATVHSTATHLRVAVRLVEVASGTQLWSERFESGLEDLFEVQDRISRRIAEALRVELGSAASMGDVPAGAVELYLRGRRQLISFRILGPDGAIDLLEQSLELAPDMQPALACYAIACTRAWFVPPPPDPRPSDLRNWEAVAKESVARAVEHAPEQAETHLARAMLAMQLGEGREAVQALVKALDIAPTYAHAHQYLAQLQCEAGNAKEGIERARLAHDLEPSLLGALMDVARLQALRGDREACERTLAIVERDSPTRRMTTTFRVRLAAWSGDFDQVRRLTEEIQAEGLEGFASFVVGFAQAIAGLTPREGVDRMVASLIADARSPRFLTLMYQLCTEIYAALGAHQTALTYFLRAADCVLIDIEWADRCPLLAGLRALPEYVQGRQTVRRRVQAMW
ncbi:MAG TPA: protein kinase, partial [Nannocystis sp.]